MLIWVVDVLVDQRQFIIPVPTHADHPVPGNHPIPDAEAGIVYPGHEAVQVEQGWHNDYAVFGVYPQTHALQIGTLPTAWV